MSQEKVWLKPRALALGLAVALGVSGFKRGSREPKVIRWKSTGIVETGGFQPGTEQNRLRPGGEICRSGSRQHFIV